MRRRRNPNAGSSAAENCTPSRQTKTRSSYETSIPPVRLPPPGHPGHPGDRPVQPVRPLQGYYKPSTGTWVRPHYKTQTNATNHDNYSTWGNQNLYTGDEGYRARDYSPQAYDYGQGRTIHTGPRGGQYYINSHGNKTYVPKRH